MKKFILSAVFFLALLELLPRAEEAGVIGHVEHRHEADPPRVPLRRALLYQDWNAAVDRLVYLRVTL